MRVVLVHDLLVQWGGAERVLAAFGALFPDAPIYTLIYDKKLIETYFPSRNVRASFLQKLPYWMLKRYRLLLPFMPFAVSRMSIGEFDLVISSSSAFAKGVRRGAHAIHVCYCHAPSRFLWDDRDQYQKDNRFHPLLRFIITLITFPLRMWDRASAERVDIWIANSKTTQERIRRLYQKPSAVVYPPIPSLNNRAHNKPGSEDYFLVVSRLSAYKKIDVLVQAFSRLNIPLVVVGAGAEEERLKTMAGKTVTFAGFVSDAELAGYYAGCRAFVTVCDDDFGMSAVEALSFGKPVLAYQKGGVMEWMEEGRTGEFFTAQTVEAVCDGVRSFMQKKKKYDHAYIMKKAEEFSEKRFSENCMRLIPR